MTGETTTTTEGRDFRFEGPSILWEEFRRAVLQIFKRADYRGTIERERERVAFYRLMSNERKSANRPA